MDLEADRLKGIGNYCTDVEDSYVTSETTGSKDSIRDHPVLVQLQHFTSWGI